MHGIHAVMHASGDNLLVTSVANHLEDKNYQSIIDALYDQASALGEEDRESGSVVERLSSTDKSRNGLCGIAEIRKQRLLDALLFTEADDVVQLSLIHI